MKIQGKGTEQVPLGTSNLEKKMLLSQLTTIYYLSRSQILTSILNIDLYWTRPCGTHMIQVPKASHSPSFLPSFRGFQSWPLQPLLPSASDEPVESLHGPISLLGAAAGIIPAGAP